MSTGKRIVAAIKKIHSLSLFTGRAELAHGSVFVRGVIVLKKG